MTFEDECARMRLIDELYPYPKDTLGVSLDGWGKPVVNSYPERRPASEHVASRNEEIAAMIAQLQAFIDHPSPDEEQLKRLAKVSKQLRKMGWPKTAINGETWRNLHQGVALAPNEMTLREADQRNIDHLAKGYTP